MLFSAQRITGAALRRPGKLAINRDLIRLKGFC